MASSCTTYCQVVGDGLGLFDGDNVPDFVAKRDDLEYYFKTLAPPEMPNKTDDGKPERVD